MSSSNTVNTKWEKISKRSKGWHMFIRVSLLANVPLMLILIFMLEIINGYRQDDFRLLLFISIGKLILSYLCGVYAGKLEWDFLKKMVEKKFEKTKSIRNSYIYIYGVWMFGTNFTISLLDPTLEDLSLTIIKLLICPLAGVMWGVLMMWMLSSNLEKYINKKI